MATASYTTSRDMTATLECELLDRRKFQTKAEARMAIFEFIEGWYNPGRRHSALGYLSPIDYERSALDTLGYATINDWRRLQVADSLLTKRRAACPSVATS